MFDRSRGYKTSFDEGKLIPFYCDEVIPGDTHKLRATMFARMPSSLIKPTLDNMYLETFFFFVPNRLVWPNWAKMWGEQTDPGDSTDYLTPEVDPGPGGILATEGSIFDYWGLPVGVQNLKCNALPFRAYNLIWKEWFRDQNLQNSPTINTDDGPDAPGDFPIRNRGKRHDYLTAALPFPQKGPDVLTPLGQSAPIVGTGPMTFDFTGTSATLSATASNPPGGTASTAQFGGFGPANATPIFESGLEADLSNATSATINELREAFVAQQFYEMLARGGSRYTEMLMAIYGVSNGDARLQRPEYLGGGRSSIFVNPVFNTAGQQVAGAPNQADLAAYAVVSSSPSDGHSFNKAFTEHGYIVGLLCVRADLNYQQGIPRYLSRRGKFDYAIPHFAHLGEQAILNKEIFAQGIPAVDDAAFGYIPRYDDYRYGMNLVTGRLRSVATSSLDFYHLAQDFASLPTLSDSFIQEDAPIERIVTVPTEPHFILDAWISVKSVRELPTYSVPGLRRL